MMHVAVPATMLVAPAMPTAMIDNDHLLAALMHMTVAMTLAALDDHRLRFGFADSGRGRQREGRECGGRDKQVSHSFLLWYRTQARGSTFRSKEITERTFNASPAMRV
jgi:hypothetical protein